VPAVNLDTAYPTNFLVANWDGSFAGGPGRLRLFSVSGPVNAPVFQDYSGLPAGGLFVMAGAGFGNPSWISELPSTVNFAPQSGTTNKIFIGDARIQNVVYRNGLLWCAQHVFLPTNAVARCAVQWWSLTPGSTVLQHGRMDDATGVKFYAYPSIAVNQYDDVLLGYSRFAANQFPSANYAFHSFQSGPGTLWADTVLKAGEARFVVPADGLNLWGDWSASVVDPVNDTDLWTIQEYAATPVSGIDRWGTWWGRVSPPVSLSVSVADAPDPVLAGSEVTYSIRLTNNTARLATGVRLVNTLPPGANFISAQSSLGSCAHTSGVVTCTIGDLPGEVASNVVVTATIVARLNQGGSATNTVVALSFGPDDNTLDDTARAVTQVNTSADLAVTLSASPSLVVLGNNVTYAVTLTNRGPSSAASAFLTNVLPAGVAFVSATPSSGTCSHLSGRVTCSFATLAVNAGASVSIVGRADVSGSLSNRANAVSVSATIDPNPSNSVASAIVRASAAPTIQAIPGTRTINEDTVLAPIPFTIGDIETPLDSLALTTSSSNPSLVPVANIAFGGSGANRSISATPLPNGFGTTFITNTVRDGDGLLATNWFRLDVLSVPDLPTISDIADQTVNEDTMPAPINFTIFDVETPAASLSVSAASSNPALIPNASIILGGSGSNRTVTFRPATNQSGTATITITVGDGTGTTNDMFLVTVVDVNDLPTINDVGNRSLAEDSTGTTIGLIIGDVETPSGSLVLSATSSNLTLLPVGNITFGGSAGSPTVTVVPAPNQFGTSLVTLIVTDLNGGSTNDTFLLTVNPVNDPPTLASNAPLTINEDAGTTNVTLTGISYGPANEGQTNRITATSSRPTLIPHPTVAYNSPDATGTLSFAPVAHSNGVATITVTVNDGGLSNSVVTRTFDVTVTAVPDAPSISGLANTTIDEDTTTGPMPFVLADVDSPLASVTASARSLNTTLVPDANISLGGAGANRTISVTPAPNQSGAATIRVTATDGVATNAVEFTVTVSPVNDPPSITAMANRTIDEDTRALLSFRIDDLETVTADLLLSATSSNPDLTPNVLFDGNGPDRTVDILPATNLSGTATINVTVRDDEGGSNTTSFVLTVVRVNDPPTLNSMAGLTIDEDAPLQTVQLSGIGSGAPDETQPLAVSAVSSNFDVISNITVVYTSANPTGRLEFVPVPNASGTATISVTVNDGGASNNIVTRSFDVQVSAVNDPPSIASIGNESTAEDTAKTIVLNVSDPETSVAQLTVRAESSNPELLDDTGISVTAGSSRTLLLTPLPDQSGQSTTITVFVNDGTNEVSTTFDLTVDPVNDPPTLNGLANLTIHQDSGPTNLVFTVEDVESLPSSLLTSATSGNQTLVPDANLSVTGNTATRTLTIQPAAGQSGTAVIQVIVRDGAGASAASTTNSFTLTVEGPQVSLQIERSGNTAIVSWPTNSPGWTLQSTTNVALPASWNNVAGNPGVANGRYTVTNALDEAVLFYRLRRP
jgi:uncharacterized repeat protein (TIGR01451 family)